MFTSILTQLKKLETVFTEHGEERYASVIKQALSGTEEELNAFLTSNLLWVGSGSIADQAGMGQLRGEAKRNIEAALIALGEQQIQCGVVNVRTANWVAVFSKWRHDGI